MSILNVVILSRDLVGTVIKSRKTSFVYCDLEKKIKKTLDFVSWVCRTDSFRFINLEKNVYV